MESKYEDKLVGKKIFMKELIQHNIGSDCWISVRGKVYNVTDWIPKHPGGYDTIVLNGGRDATQMFEAYHPIKIYQNLDKYYIGELVDCEYPAFPPMSQFYITLKKKIEDYFIERNISPKYAPEMLLRSVLLVIAFFFFHYLSLTTTSFPVAIIFASIVGFVAALISFMPVHEGSHASTTKSPLIWRLMGAVHDFVNGASFYNWCHQHFLGHHPFTNLTNESKSETDALDPDVVTNEPDVRRIKPYQKWHDHYRWQVIYAPMLYGLLGIKFRISDFIILFITKKNGYIRVNPMNSWHLTMFFVGKLFFLIYRFIVPAYYIGIIRTLGLFVVSDLITSYTLAFVFQVNHVIPQAKWPQVDTKTNTVNMDWAEMQIVTTLDYAHGSWITTFLTGALNYQVIHHLFPYISQIHYPGIAPIVREHCKQHKIQFNYLPTFTQAFLAHIKHLSQMGHAHSEF